MTHKFFAFISYSHKDIRTAKRLQFLLESYNLPTQIQKIKPEVPKRIKVFRDNDELTSGVLSEELHNKLDESKYLIVICSQNSAQSKYVGEEIAYYRSKGREKEIIPFIIDGIPHSRIQECFHKQLTLGGLELLGIDVQAENSKFHSIRFHKAFIRLIAKMLEVDYGILWNRRKHFIIKLLSLFAITLSIIIGLSVLTFKSQPFDLSLLLSQSYKKALPLSADETDSIYLYLSDTDKRSFTIKNIKQPIIFPNLPGKYKGKNIRIIMKAYGFMPLDTIIKLQDNILIPISRNTETYGRVRYCIKDNETEKPIADAVIDFGFTTTITNKDGILDILVPLNQQQVSYPVKIIVDGKPMHMTYSKEGDFLYASNSESNNTIYVQKGENK